MWRSYGVAFSISPTRHGCLDHQISRVDMRRTTQVSPHRLPDSSGMSSMVQLPAHDGKVSERRKNR